MTSEELSRARRSPENKARLAELKKLEQMDDVSRAAVEKLFDVKALALQTTKIYEKVDHMLGLVRYGILNEAEAAELHLEECTALLLPLQIQVAQEQAVYNRLVNDKKCSLESDQVKASAELLQAAKEKWSKATVEANKQTMYRAAFGMLRKADPALSEQDWAALPIVAKTLVTDLLAKEIFGFLSIRPSDGLKVVPQHCTRG